MAGRVCGDSCCILNLNAIDIAMKKYIISYSGAVDIKAKDEEAALQQFFNMTDAELGATIEEYGEIEERKI